MKTNFEEIRNKLTSIEKDSSRINTINDMSLNSESLMSSSRVERSNKDKNIDNKLETINKIGERLYEKLLEKVKLIFNCAKGEKAERS